MYDCSCISNSSVLWIQSFNWKCTTHNTLPETCSCRNVHRNLTDFISPFLIVYRTLSFYTWSI